MLNTIKYKGQVYKRIDNDISQRSEKLHKDLNTITKFIKRDIPSSLDNFSFDKAIAELEKAITEVKRIQAESRKLKGVTEYR